MHADLRELEDRLWDAADELRANSGLKASEYSAPVLGLIFLRFADGRFEAARAAIEAKGSARRRIGPSDYPAGFEDDAQVARVVLEVLGRGELAAEIDAAKALA